MRLYALLLGTLLTAASAYVAQMAVTSSRFDRAWQVLHPAADPPSSDPVRYGGILHPLAVERRIPRTPAAGVPHPHVLHHGQCPGAEVAGPASPARGQAR